MNETMRFSNLECMIEDGIRREILHGRLIELPPAELRHEIIASRIHSSLAVYNDQAGHGDVFGSGMGYKVLKNDRTWIQPDVSFLRAGRVNSDDDYFAGAPDLAVDVVSPGESAQDVEDKVQTFLAGGSHAVIVVYPKRRLVKLHIADGSARSLHENDTLSIPGLLPGWALPLKRIFVD